MWSIVDTLAHEYGWTKDYILTQVYPIDVVRLLPFIKKRALNAFIDALQINVITDSSLKEKDKSQFIGTTNDMRNQTSPKPPVREFDRSKFEELRKAMGAKKGKAAQRTK